MEYSTQGLEKIETTYTYRNAITASRKIAEAQDLVGPSTACFAHLCLAAAEAQNWAAYLGGGGAAYMLMQKLMGGS